MSADDTSSKFEQTLLPHLDAAYNLARWLTASEHDAQDVTQEAYLRALTFFAAQRGANPRAWLLTIVRNTCFTWLQKNRRGEVSAPISPDDLMDSGTTALNPEVLAMRHADRQLVRQAIEELPVEFREVIVLREMEELSYKEIGEVAGIPLGTVMSRLARARAQLEQNLAPRGGESKQDKGSGRGM
ncbi:MAG TPA: sigma-70 family RNA polymerase sigma factor [Lacipirellulaceae bacterium]|nr:sigma-70 family RNA polymerase sigma factor [Lacipirellulaceae bacterium]